MMFQLRDAMVSDKATKGCVDKREVDRAYTVDSMEASRKRKRQEDSDLPDDQELHLSNGQLLKLTKSRSPTASFFDPKIRLTHEEDSIKITPKPDYDNNRMSLDLELNLSPSLVDLNHHNYHHRNHTNDNNHDDDHDHHRYHHQEKKIKTEKGPELGPAGRSLQWLVRDQDGGGGHRGGGNCGGGQEEEGEEEEEMVARVCLKCHMLVILCKASPSCPNCKFMHSPQQSSQFNFLFKPSSSSSTSSSSSSCLSLLC